MIDLILEITPIAMNFWQWFQKHCYRGSIELLQKKIILVDVTTVAIDI